MNSKNKFANKQLVSTKSKILIQRIYNRNKTDIQKQRSNNYQQLIRYYDIKLPIPISIQKIILLIEMQLNAAITRAKLVPYLFIVADLCRLGVIHVNSKQEMNQYKLINIWDVISLPVKLYNRFNYRLTKQQYNSGEIVEFFKGYYSHSMNFNQGKLWLISNILTNTVTGESIIFDYPNLVIYSGIFRRFTRLHYEARPYPVETDQQYLSHTNSLLKLKTLSYLTFYHR